MHDVLKRANGMTLPPLRSPSTTLRAAAEVTPSSNSSRGRHNKGKQKKGKKAKTPRTPDTPDTPDSDSSLSMCRNVVGSCESHRMVATTHRCAIISRVSPPHSFLSFRRISPHTLLISSPVPRTRSGYSDDDEFIVISGSDCSVSGDGNMFAMEKAAGPKIDTATILTRCVCAVSVAAFVAHAWKQGGGAAVATGKSVESAYDDWSVLIDCCTLGRWSGASSAHEPPPVIPFPSPFPPPPLRSNELVEKMDSDLGRINASSGLDPAVGRALLAGFRYDVQVGWNVGNVWAVVVVARWHCIVIG